MRRVLWTTVFFNLVGGAAFAFPASFAGQLAGLPPETPPIYRATVALFVVTFAGAYAWLARQAEIDRPMVALAAIGKAGFFAVTLALWLVGTASAMTVMAATGDLVFAALFLRWLMATKGSADPGLLE